MTALAEASGQETTELKERIYSQALEDVPIEEIEKAAWSMIKSRTLSSFPKIGEIREAIGGKNEAVAEIEAAKFIAAIGRVGGYSSVCFDDAITQAVIHHGFGGWSKLCAEFTYEQQKWFMKDFVKFYGSFSRQGLKVNGVLQGRGGGKADSPKLIGNTEKAMHIMNTPIENSRFQVTAIPENVRELIGHTFKSDEEED
ncbi:MAG: hypothetical protein HGA69_00520 [Desulfobulbaceae bacterium]|nr:hypothetical protein [Desulfobulbaceae bacterium]